MVSSAASCFCGVTPAQHAGSTEMRASGSTAFSKSAFDTTQMSVHRPTSSTCSSSCSAICLTARASSVEPNVGLSNTWSAGTSSATSGRSCQPSVPLMQWGTGRYVPSCVER